MRNIFFVILILIFNLSNASAQHTAPVLKDETTDDVRRLYTVGNVKGTVKSSAVYLVKPVYPPEARQAGAEGAVRVKITVDEEGGVVSAKAIEGDSMLRTVCEEAARRTKFRIAHDAGGIAVKIEGVLTYNFTIQKAGWTRIGYGLSFIGELPDSFFSIPTAAKAFAPDWTNERQMLRELAEITKNKSPMPPSPILVSQSLTMSKSPVRASGGTTQNSVIRQERLILPSPPSAEQIALARNLVSALQNRLGNDEFGLWQFNLGLDLSRAFQLFRHPTERAAAAKIVRQSAENAPAGVSPEVRSALKNMAANFEKPKRTTEDAGEPGKLLKAILNDK